MLDSPLEALSLGTLCIEKYSNPQAMLDFRAESLMIGMIHTEKLSSHELRHALE